MFKKFCLLHETRQLLAVIVQRSNNKIVAERLSQCWSCLRLPQLTVRSCRNKKRVNSASQVRIPAIPAAASTGTKSETLFVTPSPIPYISMLAYDNIIWKYETFKIF